MSKPLLIVDIQPAYYPYMNDCIDTVDTMNFIKNYEGKVYALWVGEGLTEDEDWNVYDFFAEHEINIDAITFIEKDYAWIRDEMESDEDAILEKLKSGDCEYAIERLECLPNDMHIIGGGRNECLAEVEHTLTFMGKETERIEQYIY